MSIADKLTQIAENVPKVFEAGQKLEYDRFWDAFQDNGNRINYYNAFRGYGWTVENLKPKYDIIPSGANNAGQAMFGGMLKFNGSLVDAFDKRGVRLDTSLVQTFSDMFNACNYVTEIPHIDLSSATSVMSTFYGCRKVTSLSITLPDRELVFTNFVRDMIALENLDITGTINGNGFNISWSTKLTHDSLMSIINALADKSGDTSGTAWAIVIGSANLAKLTNEEIQIAQNKGWAVN